MKRSEAIFDTNKRVGGVDSTAMNELNEKLGPVIKVRPDQVKFNPKNKDFQSDSFGGIDTVSFDAFVDDISKNGIHDAIILRPDYVLIAGERRTRAALKLNMQSMDARIYYGDLSSLRERQFIIRDNLQRRQLTPARRDELIREYYKEDLKKDNRGKKSGENLAKKVSKEMSMPIGTAKRLVASARKPIVKQQSMKSKIVKMPLKSPLHVVSKCLSELKTIKSAKMSDKIKAATIAQEISMVISKMKDLKSDLQNNET